jgi:hypothetical protein
MIRIKIFVTLVFTFSASATSCHDIASLVTAFKLKDVLSAKGAAKIDELGDNKSSKNRYSFKSLCDDEDLLQNIEYMKRTHFMKKCNSTNLYEDIEVAKGSDISRVLEKFRVEDDLRCTSQQEIKFENLYKNLVTTIKSEFLKEKSNYKHICNSARKAFPKIEKLYQECD